jgi:hypothetical protein
MVMQLTPWVHSKDREQIKHYWCAGAGSQYYNADPYHNGEKLE